MAEILIKGMEMPKDMSNPLHISIFSNGSVWVTHEGKTEATAQELPPHGRLGDLDKLAKRAENRYGADFSEFIKDAPTILEASE